MSLRTPSINPDPLVACVLAAGEVQLRGRKAEIVRVERDALFSRIASFNAHERAVYRALLAKFTPEQAAKMVLRSRSKAGEGS